MKIYAKNVYRDFGDEGKGQNRYTLYTLVRFYSDTTIPEQNIVAGQTILREKTYNCSASVRNDGTVISAQENTDYQIDNEIIQLTGQHADKSAWLADPDKGPTGQAYIVDLSAFQPQTPPQPDPVVIAENDFRAKVSEAVFWSNAVAAGVDVQDRLDAATAALSDAKVALSAAMSDKPSNTKVGG